MIYFKKHQGKGLYEVQLTEGNKHGLDSYILDYTINGECELIYCDNTDELVGILKYSHDDFVVKIDSIEIFLPYRRKGYAKHVITRLKSLYPTHTIIGQASPYNSAMSLFKSQGAVFNSCSDCFCYNLCGGSECLGVYCDNPNDYTFSIPVRSKIQEHEICVTNTVHSNIPVIVVEFGSIETEDDEEYDYDEVECIDNVINNVNNTFNNSIDLVYSTCEGSTPIKSLKIGTNLPYYMDNDGKDFIEKLKSLNLRGFVQIAGIHRELCVAHVAKIIKANIPNLEPLILINDAYSVSATWSVAYGDTLERILGEDKYSPRQI